METIFTLLNTAALTGWSVILAILLSQSEEWTTQFFSPSLSQHMLLIDLLFALEAICFIEVGRIALGQIKGNLVLGIVLHVIRLSCLFLVLPQGIAADDYLCKMVLYSWALTEVGRYPMYIFPSSSIARWVRMVVPIVTFPIGAIAEAVGAYNALLELWDRENVDGLYWLKIGLLGMVVGINSLLGPTMAYPALLKKGLPVLLGKKDGKSNTKYKKSE